MLRLIIITVSALASLSSFATPKGLERLNFLPDADAYARVGYRYSFLHVETPKNTTNTKEVHNMTNLFQGEYAHRFGRKFYLGARFFYEEASENAVSYGIPFPRRFSSHGAKEPELFIIYRLKDQGEDAGLVDVNLALSPKGGRREIERDNSNRLNARTIIDLRLSHGFLEEDWEFKSELATKYFGRGIEENAEEGKDFTLESYQEFSFDFRAQYRISEWLLATAGVGVMYRGTQEVEDSGGDSREIQAGTGSRFHLGLKKPLGDWTLVEFSYSILRRDYFVKGVSRNLEGDESLQHFDLVYSMAF